MPHIEIDRFDVSANYSIYGSFLRPQVGQLSLSVLDTSLRGNSSARIFKRNGVEYLTIEQAELIIERLKLGNIKFSLPQGTTRMTGFIFNTLLNASDGIWFKILLKIFEKQFDKIHIGITNDFIRNVPVSYVFND